MAEDATQGSDTPATANGSDNQPMVSLISQYVKDMSVENPNAPDSYNWQGQPEIDIQVNIGSRALNDEVHESELKIAVTARHDEGIAFAVELAYCGLFGIRNIPEDAQHQFIFAEAPRLIFPFARRILADAVRDAGYPPLMLEPIDFNALYVQQRSKAPADADAPVGQA